MIVFTFKFFRLLVLATLPLVATATHQVGGHLEMQSQGNGRYHIIVTQYFEDGTAGISRQSSTGTLGIFRKSDNVMMTSFTVTETGTRQPVIYANEYCAQQRNLNFVVSSFEATIQLTLSSYTDSQGYYISYQTRNRNAGLNNIANPDQTGFTFYLEFPALMQNGQAISYSSPHFGPINGEYVCLGEPFTFPFGGTDVDGDELRYSMVTPLNQKTSGGNNNMSTVSSGPYPDVSWLSGFSATNAIPGSPTLTVNPKTGLLSVTATQLGLFVFAVKIEEYRNGVKIGEVRRDFQFLVIECPPQTTSNPSVEILNKPELQSTTICYGTQVVLQANVNPDWNYQWQKDGINLAGATQSALTVDEEGAYTLLVSTKAVCSKVGISDTLTVHVVGKQASLSLKGHLCAETGSVTLTATSGTGVVYSWYHDNQLLTTTTDSLQTSDAGSYWSVLTYTSVGCTISTDTATLVRSAPVVATIQSTSGFNRICPDDSLNLQGSGGISYVWYKDGQVTPDNNNATLQAGSAGNYYLIAIDADGCEGTSPTITLTQLIAPTVTLDSIPGVCGPENPVYTLVGSPAGGEFSGAGVTGNTFSPEQAGIGDHVITYGVKAAPECDATVATRIAVVAPIPTIDLPNSMTTYRGNTFVLNATYTGNPNQFLWLSNTYLDQDNVANPTVINIANDITYTIDVQNSTGCAAKDTIVITVYAGVWVPDAFSPNSDGINDVWDLPGIEAFPEAIVTVFNRWGEVIYSSDKGYHKPFDGTLNGVSLPGGVYAYTVRTVPDRPILRGKLFLIR